jgi:TRAP-type C4-dicarboxylate transport system permease large subunit
LRRPIHEKRFALFSKPVLQLYVVSLPFIVILLLALAIITYLPWLSLVLIG